VRFVVIVGREVTRPAPRAAVTAADESQIRILSLLDIYAVRSKRERDENEMQHRHEQNRLSNASKQSGCENVLIF